MEDPLTLPRLGSLQWKAVLWFLPLSDATYVDSLRISAQAPIMTAPPKRPPLLSTRVNVNNGQRRRLLPEPQFFGAPMHLADII
ncbi:hypothetical protein QBC38DRAFT_212401 [Podospora fimiseda]|uniref:Uncharacterized protein n=1 Tax=Podospora fimiseda TaxID=252190 RepID=A0AAN7BP75_9PEZI|nr:hypothetical protein QBC38DRAFT_212401 [Podospora fimiseda]